MRRKIILMMTDCTHQTLTLKRWVLQLIRSIRKKFLSYLHLSKTYLESFPNSYKMSSKRCQGFQSEDCIIYFNLDRRFSFIFSPLPSCPEFHTCSISYEKALFLFNNLWEIRKNQVYCRWLPNADYEVTRTVSQFSCDCSLCFTPFFVR